MTLWISDVQMPGMNGIELQSKLIVQGYRLPIIFVTAFSETRARAQALAAGASGFLAKPFSDEELITCLNEALAEIHSRFANRLRAVLAVGGWRIAMRPRSLPSRGFGGQSWGAADREGPGNWCRHRAAHQEQIGVCVSAGFLDWQTQSVVGGRSAGRKARDGS